MAKAMDIADYIITKAKLDGQEVSNLELQKISYFLNVIYMLNNKGKALIDDEHFKKWDYGPVLTDVYHEYSRYGAEKIDAPLKHMVLIRNGDSFKVESRDFDKSRLNEEEINVIDENIYLFYKFGPFDLVNKSHEEPQWRDRESIDYSNKKTFSFYNDKNKRFWDKL